MSVDEELLDTSYKCRADPVNTKTYRNCEAGTEEKLAKAAEYKANAKAGSLASKANMVKEFNERNSRK